MTDKHCTLTADKITAIKTRSSVVAVIADRTACSSTVGCKIHYCVISVLTPFIVIAAPRPVNKNVSTGAVMRAKRGTEPGVHKLLANYQSCGYKFRPTIGRNVPAVRL